MHCFRLSAIRIYWVHWNCIERIPPVSRYPQKLSKEKVKRELTLNLEALEQQNDAKCLKTSWRLGCLFGSKLSARLPVVRLRCRASATWETLLTSHVPHARHWYWAESEKDIWKIFEFLDTLRLRHQTGERLETVTVTDFGSRNWDVQMTFWIGDSDSWRSKIKKVQTL